MLPSSNWIFVCTEQHNQEKASPFLHTLQLTLQIIQHKNIIVFCERQITNIQVQITANVFEDMHSTTNLILYVGFS